MSSRSYQSTSTVTRTVRTVGPDGKVQTQTVTEERRVGGDGKTETVVKTQSESPSDFDSFFSQPGSFSLAGKLDLFKGFPRTTGPQIEELPSDPKDSENMGSLFSKNKEQDTPKRASGCFSDFQKEALAKHNELRKKHGVGPLSLNADLCRYAEEWAEEMGKTGKFAHRPDQKYGENIFYGMNSRGINPMEAIDKWYGEISKMNFNDPDGSRGTGHFTQLVWKDSKELGIGKCEPKEGSVYVVANYDPPGNWMGKSKDNVFPPK